MNLLCCGSGKPKAKRLKLTHEASSNLRARAVKDYSNVHDPSHISFHEGELITVTEQNPSSGIWKGFRCGAYNGVMTRTGYFPANAVVLIDPQLNEQTARKNSSFSSELSRHHRSHKHQGNGLKFADSSSQGTPPSPLVKHKIGHTDADDENGLHRTGPHHTQNSFGGQHHGGNLAVRLPAGGDLAGGKESPGGTSLGSSASAYQTSCQACNGVLSQQQHRLSGQSCESGVSSSSSRQSYHSGNGINGVSGGPPSSSSNGSSSSQGSLDRLEESGYSSTANVHELLQQGHSDSEVLQTWLAGLHLEEYYRLFVEAGYDMPTISRMMPEDLTAIGITKPSVRKKLKSEIGRLTIHDGIPDHKPATVHEWLGLLHLSEYADTLTRQGYTDTNSITDITWEDLEDIGIKKLGHQKKIMLAIDRLKRINSSLRRLSGTGFRPSNTSADVSDSPLLCSRHVTRPSTAPATDSTSHVVQRAVVSTASTSSGMYSVSSGGIVHPSAGIAVTSGNPARHLQHQQQGVVGGPSATVLSNHSSAETAKTLSSFRSDDGASLSSSTSSVPARVGNHTNSVTTAAISSVAPSSIDAVGQHRHPGTVAAGRSGHATVVSRVTVGRGGDSSDGDLTPTNERRTVSPVVTAPSAASTASSSTVNHFIATSTRPSAQLVSLPKPTPLVAKISGMVPAPAVSTAVKTPIAASVVAAPPAATSPAGDWSADDIVHASTPKLDPTQRQQTGADHGPQSANGEQPGSCFSYGTLPRKFAHRHKTPLSASASVGAAEKLPRGNADISAALDDLMAVGPTSSQNDRRSQPRTCAIAPSAGNGISAGAAVGEPTTDNSSAGGRREPPVPPVRTASFKTDIRTVMLNAEARMNGNSLVNGYSSAAADGRSQYEFSGAGSCRSRFDDNSVSTSDSLLNEVIERLERSAGCTGTTGRRRNGGGVSGASGSQRLGDWQDSRSSSGSEDSDSGLESRRSESVSSLVEVGSSSSGGSTIDTNTLPFANENVGTIKQRGQSSSSTSSATASSAAKQPTVVSPSAVSGDVQKNAGPTADDWKNGNVIQSKDVNSTPHILSVETETVFNDIDGMLMGLTAELDEMLKLQG